MRGTIATTIGRAIRAALSSVRKRVASPRKADNVSLAQILNGLTTPPPRTRIFADSYGRITKMFLMIGPYASGEARTQLLGEYGIFFCRLEPDTKFVVMYQTDQDKSDVEQVISANKVTNPERIEFLKADFDITIWARDCMVCLYLPDDPTRTAVLNKTPLHFWQTGSPLVPPALTAFDKTIVLVNDPFIVTDGGDVEADTEHAYVGDYSLVLTAMKIYGALEQDAALKTKVFAYYKKRSGGKEIVEPQAGDMHFPFLRQTVQDGALTPDPQFKRVDLGDGKITYEQALEELAAWLFEEHFDKPVRVMGRDDPHNPSVELEDATDHLDMGMTAVDDEVFFVGSAALGKQILASLSPSERDSLQGNVSAFYAAHGVADYKLPEVEPEGAFEPRNRGNEDDFEAYVDWLQTWGKSVKRVPCLEPPQPGLPYYTGDNCDMQRFERDGKKVRNVFLPVVGVKTWDDAFSAPYEEEGFEVIPVPMSEVLAMLGAVRCTSNWLARSPRG